MRLVSTAKCLAGMVIAKPIYTETGTVLVGEGVALTQRMIDSLRSRGVAVLYIKDSVTDDILIEEDIPLELRVESVRAIRYAFDAVTKANPRWRKAVELSIVDKLHSIFRSLIAELNKSKNAISLLSNIQIHDDYVFSHSTNVTLYSLAMAVKMGTFSEKNLMELGLGGMLHDIGKTMIPLEILNKKGKLTKEEYDVVKQHPQWGFDLLRTQPDISLLSAHCAFQHHEKIDGSGYPRGIKGSEIHPYAKIMAIADVFDALTSNRAYRGAILPHEAMEIIFAGADTHFETEMIKLFQKSVASYPVGVTVKLNTGETAVVIQYLFNSPGRPIVRVIKEPGGQPLDKPYEIDLSKELTVIITESDAIL